MNLYPPPSPVSVDRGIPDGMDELEYLGTTHRERGVICASAKEG